MGKARILRFLEVPVLIAVPVFLIACAVLQMESTGVVTMAVALLGVLVFFASFEASEPQLGQIMPAVVLAALASAGRALFMVAPGVQPVTAIVIIAGAAFGKRCGFMVGVLSALVSGAFMGMGPWTAWQMYSWGLVGYLAGAFASLGVFGNGTPEDTKAQRIALYVFGIFGSFLFGFVMNTWSVASFIQPFSWPAAIAMYASGAAADAVHATSTVVFLLLLYEPWRRKLNRIKGKYAMLG